jgi:hypothetical protein
MVEVEEKAAIQTLKLLDKLEELDDVQKYIVMLISPTSKLRSIIQETTSK